MEEWLREFLVLLPAILWAMTIHEFSHGMVAYALGDETPKLTNRLTLNPLSHIDIIGFIALVLVHFGWAKPVLINPANFRRLRGYPGVVLVSVAGPLANIISAFFCALLIKFIPFESITPYISTPLFLMLKYGVIINIGFAVFNLLPIPPLDGSKILEAILPGFLREYYLRIEPYGFLILVILLLSPFVDKVLIPAMNFLLGIILGVI